MTGKELKDKLAKQDIPASAIAEKIGISPQAINSTFNAADVKSGTLERIANVLGVDMTFFYPAEGNKAVASGNNSVAAIQSTVTQGDSKVLQERINGLQRLLQEKENLLNEKERTIQILMKK